MSAENTRLTEKDRSIILQVIFKEVYKPELDPAILKAEIEAAAKVMFQLHDQFSAGGAEELALEKEFGRYSPRPQRSGGGGGGQRPGGGGGGERYVPKYDKSTLPVVKLDYFGTGQGISFHDQRPAKEVGAYSAKAADFQSVDKFEGKNIPLWIYDSQGNVNQDTVDLLGKSGISAFGAGQGVTQSAQDTSPW